MKRKPSEVKKKQSQIKKEYIIISLAVFIMIAFLAAAIVYTNYQDGKHIQMAKENNSVFNRPHSPTFGAADAKVYIVEFFDPACETCRAFYPVVKNLINSNKGKVKLVIRYASFHKGSDEAIKILEAAKIQDLYWPTLEAVLQSQPIWADHHKPQPQLIWNYLGNIGLNITKARKDAADPRINSIIEQDSADGATLNVTRTPSFFVNGKPLRDFGDAQLKKLVQDEIDATYK